MTWAFFVLPHALVAVPIATAVSPRVADAWQRGDRSGTGLLIDRAARTVVPLLALGGAGMVALAWPVARVASSFGQAASQGVAPIAHALAMFGLGLVGYGMSFTMVRVLFSLGEVKSASILVVVAAFPAYVAGRHVWIQSQPEGSVPSCGASLDFMLDVFPLMTVVKKVLTGGGECAKIDWSLLGLSMPAWVLVAVLLLVGWGLWVNLSRQTPVPA
jgi:disulfide bond formation protein DsbB